MVATVDQLIHGVRARRYRVRLVHPRENARQRRWQRVEQVIELAVVQHGSHVLPGGHLGELRFGKSGVHHGQPQTGTPGRADREHQAAVVTRQDPDHRTGRKALRQ